MDPVLLNQKVWASCLVCISNSLLSSDINNVMNRARGHQLFWLGNSEWCIWISVFLEFPTEVNAPLKKGRHPADQFDEVQLLPWTQRKQCERWAFFFFFFFTNIKLEIILEKHSLFGGQERRLRRGDVSRLPGGKAGRLTIPVYLAKTSPISSCFPTQF